MMRVILTPSCWSQNYTYSEAWDKKLNALMDEHDFTEITEHTAQIGEVCVWVANHPYASFTPYGNMPSVRPKRTTILRAWDKLVSDMVNAKRPA